MGYSSLNTFQPDSIQPEYEKNVSIQACIHEYVTSQELLPPDSYRELPIAIGRVDAPDSYREPPNSCSLLFWRHDSYREKRFVSMGYSVS